MVTYIVRMQVDVCSPLSDFHTALEVITWISAETKQTECFLLTENLVERLDERYVLGISG